jgi:DNA repair protein RadC
MLTGKRSNSKISPQPASDDVDSVLETVRSLWAATDQADAAVRAWSQKAIIDGIARLHRQVTAKLRLAASMPQVQARLFPEEAKDDESPACPAAPQTTVPVASETTRPRFPEPTLRVYAKALTDQALQAIPQAADFSDLDAYRKHLTDTLPFNSRETRRRNSNYLVSRYFPGEALNTDLPRFAAATKGTPALAEALFYLTCRTEKIVAQVAEEVVFPSLPQGGVLRSKIRDYIQSQLPKSKSAKQATIACVDTYQTFGIGSATRTRLNVSLREGSLVSFAYVLHLEFSEPGMYAFERMVDGPMHTWLLWDRKWMVQQLYRLREGSKLNWSSTDSLCGEPIMTKYADDIAYLTAAFRGQKEGFTLHPVLEPTPWFI